MSTAAPALGTVATVDQRRLEQLEQVIEQGLARFVEAGRGLLEIRDSRLYRATHASFEHYCHERWGFRRAHAHRLIQSARVLHVLSPTGDTPASERHARELAPLLTQPTALREAWADARDRAGSTGRPLSSIHIREAVAKRLPDRQTDVEDLVGSDRWATPRALFKRLDAEFGFELDVCALPENATCAAYYTPAQDGLRQPWSGTCWMNPPYGRTISTWVEKASHSAVDGTIVVSLLPVHTETGWWWNHCRHAEIRFLRGRLHYSNAPTAAPFASAIVVFGQPAQVKWWDWQRETSP